MKNQNVVKGKKKFKESMKKLKINPAIYHGGDFEEKAMLDC